MDLYTSAPIPDPRKLQPRENPNLTSLSERLQAGEPRCIWAFQSCEIGDLQRREADSSAIPLQRGESGRSGQARSTPAMLTKRKAPSLDFRRNIVNEGA